MAAILSGLCPKSSITLTPPASPTSSKRRLKAGEAGQRLGGLRRSGTPAASAAASAASAFSALWRPGTWRRTVSAGDLEGDRERLLDDVGPEQVGRLVPEGIGAQPLRRQRGGEEAGLVVVEVEHHRLGLGREIAEQVAELVERLVIEGDVVEHGDVRPVERDRAVALVDLADEVVAAADQSAGEGHFGR